MQLNNVGMKDIDTNHLNRKVKEPEEMQFQKENAFILMKLMREE